MHYRLDDSSRVQSSPPPPGIPAQPTPLWRELVIAVRAHAILAATLVVLCVLPAVVFLVTVPRSYTARASFVTDFGELKSPGASLTAQVGLVLGGRAGETPEFYSGLLRSRTLMTSVLQSPLPPLPSDIAGGKKGGTLIEYFGGQSQEPRLRLDKALRQLQGRTQINPNRQTGVVTVAVSARDASVAQYVVKRYLELLNEFNLAKRQSQGQAERVFLESRLAVVQKELDSAERELENFLARNREIRSPSLISTRERLTRIVGFRAGVLAGIARALEEARIEEVRNTPVVTVFDEPVAPARPDPRGGRRILLTALVLGVVAGTGAAYGRSRMGRRP